MFTRYFLLRKGRSRFSYTRSYFIIRIILISSTKNNRPNFLRLKIFRNTIFSFLYVIGKVGTSRLYRLIEVIVNGGLKFDTLSLIHHT